MTQQRFVERERKQHNIHPDTFQSYANLVTQNTISIIEIAAMSSRPIEGGFMYTLNTLGLDVEVGVKVANGACFAFHKDGDTLTTMKFDIRGNTYVPKWLTVSKLIQRAGHVEPLIVHSTPFPNTTVDISEVGEALSDRLSLVQPVIEPAIRRQVQKQYRSASQSQRRLVIRRNGSRTTRTWELVA